MILHGPMQPDHWHPQQPNWIYIWFYIMTLYIYNIYYILYIYWLRRPASCPSSPWLASAWGTPCSSCPRGSTSSRHPAQDTLLWPKNKMKNQSRGWTRHYSRYFKLCRVSSTIYPSMDFDCGRSALCVWNGISCNLSRHVCWQIDESMYAHLCLQTSYI